MNPLDLPMLVIPPSHKKEMSNFRSIVPIQFLISIKLSFIKISPSWSVYDKIDVPYTMGWSSIFMLIYNTKMVIIQKPDVMEQNG